MEKIKTRAVCEDPEKEGKTQTVVYRNSCRDILGSYIQRVVSSRD
jgi:hypothetical protein